MSQAKKHTRVPRLVAQLALLALVVGLLGTAVGTAFASTDDPSSETPAETQVVDQQTVDQQTVDQQTVDQQTETPETPSDEVTPEESRQAPETAGRAAQSDVTDQAGCTDNGGGTFTCPLNPGNANATNPGFSTVTPLSTCLNGLTQPAGPDNWAWHFVAPGNHNFISLTATFQNAGTIGPVTPNAGNSAPDASHLFLFTGEGDTLTGATAVVDADLPGGHFQLSHVCSGTPAANTGYISVEKVIDPSGGPATDGDQFVMQIDCTGDEFDQDITLTAPGDLGPKSSTAIPTDTQCTVTETAKPAAATLVSYVPNGGSATTPPQITVGDGTTVAVTVTNSYPNVGGEILVTLNVAKEVVGSATPAAGTTYTVHVVCEGALDVDETLTFTYPDGLGTQALTEQIPSDEALSCTVTETDTGGATLLGYRIDQGATGPDSTVVLDIDRDAADITVVNDPTVTVAGVSVSSAAGQLPFTGGGIDWKLPVGIVLVIGGALLVLLVRKRHDVHGLEA